jgi:hypothetical protein
MLGCHFVNHTSQLKLPGIEPETPHWEASVGFSCDVVSILCAVIFSYSASSFCLCNFCPDAITTLHLLYTFLN